MGALEGWEELDHSVAGPPAGWRSASGSSPTRCSPCRSRCMEAWRSWPPARSRSSLSSSSPPSPACRSVRSASAPPRSPLTTVLPFGSRWPPVRTEWMGLRRLGWGCDLYRCALSSLQSEFTYITNLLLSIFHRGRRCYAHFTDKRKGVQKGSVSCPVSTRTRASCNPYYRSSCERARACVCGDRKCEGWPQIDGRDRPGSVPEP